MRRDIPTAVGMSLHEGSAAAATAQCRLVRERLDNLVLVATQRTGELDVLNHVSTQPLIGIRSVICEALLVAVAVGHRVKHARDKGIRVVFIARFKISGIARPKWVNRRVNVEVEVGRRIRIGPTLVMPLNDQSVLPIEEELLYVSHAVVNEGLDRGKI